LQGGYNWQKQNWVFGIEADIQITGQKGDTNFFCPGGVCTTATFLPAATLIDSSTLNKKLKWFGTLRLRGGMTVTPTVLAYLTGGHAVGGHQVRRGAEWLLRRPPVSAPFSASNTKFGWTVGAGIEGQLSGRWTGKIEYLYIDFGAADLTALLPTNAPPLAVNFSSHITDNILRVGVNYHY
jgi:outer membrane immunogenic protein